MSVARRQIDELAALYELEPEVRDVIVEGPNDAAIFRWYLRQRCDTCASVYDIDSIEVPMDLLPGEDNSGGSRGRLLALAVELDANLQGAARRCPAVIYDADIDHLLNDCQEGDVVLSTDYSCLEMYLFNEHTMDKLLSVVLMEEDISAGNVLQSLSEVLIRLFLLKSSNHLLGYSMSWISFDNCCNCVGRNIEFDEQEFIRRYLNRNGRMGDLHAFQAKVNEVEGLLHEDDRHQINGHHFFELTRWYLRKLFGGKSVLNTIDSFSRAFFGCIDIDYLDTEELFHELRQRVDS